MEDTKIYVWQFVWRTLSLLLVLKGLECHLAKIGLSWFSHFPEILTNPNCKMRKNQAMFKPFCISFLGYTSFRAFFANCTFLFPNKTKVLLGCKSKFRGPLERWVLRCWLSIFKFSNLYFKIDIFVKNIANNLLCWLIYH